MSPHIPLGCLENGGWPFANTVFIPGNLQNPAFSLLEDLCGLEFTLNNRKILCISLGKKALINRSSKLSVFVTHLFSSSFV